MGSEARAYFEPCTQKDKDAKVPGCVGDKPMGLVTATQHRNAKKEVSIRQALVAWWNANKKEPESKRFEMPPFHDEKYKKIFAERKAMAKAHINLTASIAPLIANDPELKAIIAAMAAEKPEEAKKVKGAIQQLAAWWNHAKKEDQLK